MRHRTNRRDKVQILRRKYVFSYNYETNSIQVAYKADLFSEEKKVYEKAWCVLCADVFRPPCWLRWRKKRAVWEDRMTGKRSRIFRPLLDGRFSFGPAFLDPRRSPKPCPSASSACSCGTSSGSPGPFPPTPRSSERIRRVRDGLVKWDAALVKSANGNGVSCCSYRVKTLHMTTGNSCFWIGPQGNCSSEGLITFAWMLKWFYIWWVFTHANNISSPTVCLMRKAHQHLEPLRAP